VSTEPFVIPAPRRTISPPRYATAREIAVMALIAAVLGLLLVSALIAIFPAAKAATATADSGKQAVPLLFGLFNPKLDSDATLLLLVTLASAVGSFVHIATSFANYAGRNRFETSWVCWYALRCPIGAALATVFYFVVRAGFFSGDAPNSAVNAYGIAAVAGFVGLFSRQATDKLRELFDTLFKTDGAEEEVDPVLGSVTPNPVTVDGDPVRLTLTGSGFVRLSEVRVDGHALPAASVGPTQITVEVPAADLHGRSFVEVTVLNPGPCATSDPVVVTVQEAG
jgi:IPT/TIG domain